jgi:hypothetical protein
VLQNAIKHRQNQNAAHDILWGIGHNVMTDSWIVDQEKGEMTVERGTSIITCKIKIIGTYNHNDSTFLWSTFNKSISENLTQPVTLFLTKAKENNWDIFSKGSIKCTFQQAFDLASVVLLYSNANGIDHKITNKKTNVVYLFYDIEVKDRLFKVFNKTIPTKKQYDIVSAPELINLCKNYISDYDKNEKKYSSLYKSKNENTKYLDTMFVNRVKISDSYWDTTSTAYIYHRKNRTQAQNLDAVFYWRVVKIDDDILYVLYDEKENWGYLKTYAFEICKINHYYKIRNEFMCL